MTLEFPTLAHKDAAWAYRQEFFDAGETHIPGGAMIATAPSYEFWLEVVQSAPTREDDFYVPSSTYFAVVEGNIVGIVDIRHKLNDFLTQSGGHIGYSVRPTERRKEYATKMLRAALEKCREIGIDRVLVTCDKGNVASQKTILNNGGVYEDTFKDKKHGDVLRYWINIK